MMKRMILMLAVMMIIIGGLGFVKFRQIQTAIAQGAAFQPPPEAVTTIVVEQSEWPQTLSVIGSVAAVQGVAGERRPVRHRRSHHVRFRKGRS